MPHHLDTVPFSGIIRIRDMMYAVKDPFRLDQGDVSFDAPETVKRAMHRAIDENRSHYVQTTGIPQLLDRLVAKLRSVNGIPVAGPDEVLVTTGGIHAVYIACQALLEPDDEVIVPDPEWPPCMGNVRAARAIPVGCPLHERLGWRYAIDELQATITPRTKAIYINSPHNPTGGVLTRDDVTAIANLCREHNLWLISDECYDQITFGAEHVSPARFDTEGRVLSCFSFSKTYAMTGMRVGYVVAPPAAAGPLATMQEPVIACVNAPAQHAALAALEGPQDIVEEMRDAYRSRRDAAAAQLDAAGFSYLFPEGAFYLWIDVSPVCGGDVKTWALELLRAHGVALAPGTAFGPRGEGWARVSLATATDDLLEGLDRITRSGVPA